MNIRPQTIRAVATMTDALAELRHAAELADRDAATSCPGSQDERYALQLGRVVQHLGDAIADVPTQLWLSMCKASAEIQTPANKKTRMARAA